jgi:hypothetical protein
VSGVQVMRPSRGRGVLHVVLGDPRMQAGARRAVAIHLQRALQAASTLYPSRCDLERCVIHGRARQPPMADGG